MTTTKSLLKAAGVLVAGATLALPAAASAKSAPTAPPQHVVGEPITEENVNHVFFEARIVGADGGVVKTLACDWKLPGDDDRECLRFQGDPQNAVEAIRDAGGARAVKRVTSPEIGLDSTTRITRRAGGSWLFRTTGRSGDLDLNNGWVCDEDGYGCTMWDANGEDSAKDEVKAAAAKMQKKARKARRAKR
ncbi:hypothetical protein [Conexibacter sp. SYSU D00693]|uniref:hypothetical protein n=1 Tax=Conexibacter sp. SYSU D00693 TaxID=2812560 RepID=UPI00196B7AA1|nr:hypothetical protein [Conexibacter sp. SYSU D00693]